MIIISAYLCLLLFFLSSFKRILNALLPLLNRDQSFALTRFYSFRLKKNLGEYSCGIEHYRFDNLDEF